MTHETLIHRADAVSATGTPYPAAPEVAADAIDEWLEILTLHREDEDAAPLRTPEYAGKSLHLHATDAPGAEWLIELTPDGFTWNHSHTKATVALRGPLTDVLRVFYRRLPPSGAEVLGDAELLDSWLTWASWG
ncbi:hypothetical protein SRB5_13640 [Streptomyces sp. RB5]|uniref:MDMPI C-terminal domain-containing protein n=1 Tax=Streptomyces smaragdinus TaxID=2585196 RepID=A0A7K0CCR9_9ACTN|nr:hypothetical protein [Streptomyces smaragdinus]MQY11249.1 hypothetical protein [Streptomyces smaragdinus]